MTQVSASDGFEGGSLACRRGGRLVFDQLSFRLAPGEALILTGPNGSGKSSLLRLGAGLLARAGGDLCRNGLDVAADPVHHHADLAFVGHRNALKPTLTVRENLYFWARFNGVDDGVGKALQPLEMAALAELPAGELSAGQQRRLALSRLFLKPVGLWLLDEPTVGLDQASAQRFARAMADHLARGGMIMAATHTDLGLGDLGVRAQALDLGDFAARFGPADLEAEAWA